MTSCPYLLELDEEEESEGLEWLEEVLFKITERSESANLQKAEGAVRALTSIYRHMDFLHAKCHAAESQTDAILNFSTQPRGEA